MRLRCSGYRIPRRNSRRCLTSENVHAGYSWIPLLGHVYAPSHVYRNFRLWVWRIYARIAFCLVAILIQFLCCENIFFPTTLMYANSIQRKLILGATVSFSLLLSIRLNVAAPKREQQIFFSFNVRKF